MSSIVIIPDWLLLLLPSLSVTFFWYKALMSLALNLAYNKPSMGSCMYVVIAWGLTLSINVVAVDASFLSGGSLLDPLLFLTFFGSLFFLLYLSYVTLQCLFGQM